MKRGLVTSVITMMAIAGSINTANAEGYQINAQSTRQLGMGHTGVALKLGAESMLFNPAGMAYQPSKFDISLGMSGVISKVNYKNDAKGYNFNTDNPIGTPLFGFISYKPIENLAVGVSITNPVGNSIKWPDNWPGATLVEKIDLKGFCIQPTVSYKFSERVSVGAGLMIDFGSVNLQRALLPVGGLDFLSKLNPAFAPVIDGIAGKVPISAELKGDSKVNVGVNIGVLVNVSEKVSLGASFRSKVNFKVDEGTAELHYASDALKQLINQINTAKPGTIPVPPLEEGTFAASLPAPWNINAGVSYKPIDRLTLTAEMQFVGWQAYDTLSVQFDESVLNGYSIVAPKNYKNTFIARIGGEYTISQLATVRLGAYYDTTPVRKNLYNPETPGSNKIAITAGASIRPTKFMSIDLAVAYIGGAKQYGSYPMNDEGTVLFDGDYKAHAFMPSFGLSFRF